MRKLGLTGSRRLSEKRLVLSFNFTSLTEFGNNAVLKPNLSKIILLVNMHPKIDIFLVFSKGIEFPAIYYSVIIICPQTLFYFRTFSCFTIGHSRSLHILIQVED